MTDAHLPAERQETFADAVRISWRRSPTGLTRYAGLATGALVMVGVHVAMIVVAGNAWSWLAIGALPAAAYCLLTGWVYDRFSLRALGLMLFGGGAMVPFYLR